MQNPRSLSLSCFRSVSSASSSLSFPISCFQAWYRLLKVLSPPAGRGREKEKKGRERKESLGIPGRRKGGRGGGTILQKPLEFQSGKCDSHSEKKEKSSLSKYFFYSSLSSSPLPYRFLPTGCPKKNLLTVDMPQTCSFQYMTKGKLKQNYHR